jgi:hypothetical protein
MTWDEVVAIGLKLPGVEVSTSYRTPSLKACGKFLTRLRSEDDSLVLVGVGFDERDFLIEAEPSVFHITAHYKDYPAVLAWLDRVDPGTVAELLERRWRAVAPKRAVKARDAET